MPTPHHEVYRRLQQHMDAGPEGFPATRSGLDLRLLELLFTPEEARIALLLSTVKLEPAGKLYRRARNEGLDLGPEAFQEHLDRMYHKGILLRYREGFKEPRYKNAGVAAGGVIDFQVDRLTPELVDVYHRYQAERRAEAAPAAGPGFLPLRTVPVVESLPEAELHRVATYDDVRRLVAEAPGPLAVANCVCRQTKDIEGTPCAYSDLRETCLQLGPDHARQYVEMGIGRLIDHEEAYVILDRAQEAGYILQPENSLKPEAICCCCGDCCVLLSRITRAPRPADLYASNYFATTDTALCNGCGVCLERCQLTARAMDNSVATTNLDRCIGCGNCVVTCPTGAIALQRKPALQKPPRDKDAGNLEMLKRKRGPWRTLLLRAKLAMGMRV